VVPDGCRPRTCNGKVKSIVQGAYILMTGYQKAADRENSNTIYKLKRMVDNNCIANTNETNQLIMYHEFCNCESIAILT
jgi:hypothetical protein